MSNSSLVKMITILIMTLLFCISYSSQQNPTSRPPFLQPDTIHYVTSQFEFNLILNENRNYPVFFVQYSKDFIRSTTQNMLRGAFSKQSGISFALFVNCKNFQHNLNRTLNICSGFDLQKAEQQQKKDLQLQQDKRVDNHFVFDLMSPDPTRIKQKGHQLSKNHNIQNLRHHQTKLFNDDYLVKVLRNQIADFVSYVEDSYDMEEFLQTKSQFRTSKKAKLLYFDQNLQSPLFIKKLAARLDGRVKVGVTDNFKLAKQYKLQADNLVLFEYNFIGKAYDISQIPIQQNNELQSILQSVKISPFLRIKKSRDMMLDFQHREATVYSMSTLSELNQLVTHGRVVVLEISQAIQNYKCPVVLSIKEKYTVMLNYVCFNKKSINELENGGLKITSQIDQNDNNIYIIGETIQTAKPVTYNQKQFSIYDYLPQVPPRQKISTQSEIHLCLKTAMTSKRDPVIYWYNQKQHQNTLKLLEYFNSLPEVTSLIYFCQVYVPDNDLISRFQIKENSLFSMMDQNPQTGQIQKLEFKDALEFVSVKMFLRQLSINQMMKVYHSKLNTNTLKQVHSAQQLTKQCYNQQCIISLMATKKFRFQSQMQTLKQLKLQFSQQGYNFVWINGECHWDVAKQLKVLGKNQKQIDRSYIFYYKQKSNQFSLMTALHENKYWVKKDVKKWIKGLKQTGQIKRLKFGIDIEDKKCVKEQKQIQNLNSQKNIQNNQKSSSQQQNKKKRDVKEGEL